MSRKRQERCWEKEHRRRLTSGLDSDRAACVMSPVLFISVLDLISRNTVMKDAMKKLVYADDLTLVANGKQELQETLDE